METLLNIVGFVIGNVIGGAIGFYAVLVFLKGLHGIKGKALVIALLVAVAVLTVIVFRRGGAGI